jgi:predicted small lipoprotein YifL
MFAALPRSLATLVVAFTLAGCVQPAPTYVPPPAPARTATPIPETPPEPYLQNCVRDAGDSRAVCDCVRRRFAARYSWEQLDYFQRNKITEPMGQVVGECQAALAAPPAPTRTPIRPASWPAFRDACVKGGTPVAICVCVFNTITARYPEEEVAAITELPVTDGPLPAIVGACQQRMSTAF